MPVPWNDFARAVNELLAELSVPEDRLLGPFFLTASELLPVSAEEGDVTAESAAGKALSGKLFMYLWDDVLRHGSRESVFAKNIRTYGQLEGLFSLPTSS